MKVLKKNEQGFTLLEVLTAMMITTFSLLVLLHLAMISLDGNTWATGTTTSTQLLQQKLEELRSTHSPVSGTDTVDGVARAWTVDSVGNHLRRVRMIASWRTPDSITKVYSINTFFRTESP